MPAPYNLSVFNNSETTILTYFQFANDVTFGMFGLFFLLSLYIIMFVSFKNFSNRQAAGGAGAITFLVAVLGRSIGLIPDIALYASLVILAGTFFYLFKSNE